MFHFSGIFVKISIVNLKRGDIFMISFLIFFVFVGIFEYIKYRKRCTREEKAIYLTIKGKVIDRKIVNNPYYVGYGLRSSTNVKNLFMLIFTVQDVCGNKFEVKVTQSSFYNEINCDSYWNEENWIGAKVNWQVKKYPKSKIYVFVENLY